MRSSFGSVLIYSNDFSYCQQEVPQLRAAVFRYAWSNFLFSLYAYFPGTHILGCTARIVSEANSLQIGLHIFVWIDSDHGVQLIQVSQSWLLQDCMGTSWKGSIQLPRICLCSVRSVPLLAEPKARSGLA